MCEFENYISSRRGILQHYFHKFSIRNRITQFAAVESRINCYVCGINVKEENVK